jgi:uncharacterized membrane protein (DUF485 family)
MFIILRIIRTLIGIFAGLQILTLFNFFSIDFSSLTSLQKENLMVALFAKTILIGVPFALFVILRVIINWLYMKKFGEIHPKLKKFWNL